MEFSCSTIESGSDLEIKLKGYFDEFAKLPLEVDLDKFKTVTIDFEHVDFINSGGIKSWLMMADKLDQADHLKVYMKNCRRMVIDQINLIQGFLPANGEVSSLYIPIFCEKCEACFDVHQTIDALDEQLPQIIDRAQPEDCQEFPKCRKYFEIDIDQKGFFRFLDSK